MDALLAEVVGRPEDVTPRFAYAKQLQAAGDPRGELVHVSCALDSLAEDDPQRPALARRELALIRELLPAWATELGLGGAEIAIVRGFPDRVDTYASRFSPAVCNQIPLATLTLRGVTMTQCRELCGAASAATLRDLT